MKDSTRTLIGLLRQEHGVSFRTWGKKWRSRRANRLKMWHRFGFKLYDLEVQKARDIEQSRKRLGLS